MVDFAEVKATYSLEHVAQLLGLQLKKTGNGLRGQCPKCQGNPRALALNPERGWYCWDAKTGGDVIALVAHIKGIKPKEAAEWLHHSGSTVPRENGPDTDGVPPLQHLQSEHEAVAMLGIEPETAEALGIGYAPKGVMRGLVAVPIRRADGKIAGYIGLDHIERLPGDWKL